MRILSRLRVLSALSLLSLFALTALLLWSLREFNAVTANDQLVGAIHDNVFDAATLRDQYFLYREERSRKQMTEKSAEATQLIAQAIDQFHDGGDRQALTVLQRTMEESTSLFLRIVANTTALQTKGGSSAIYEELDKRLLSQLLVKATVIHDTANLLTQSSQRRVEQAYRRLAVGIASGALLLALVTMLTLFFVARLIRSRLAALHAGAKVVASGQLDFRLDCDGADELAEVAASINFMTGKLQSIASQLEIELAERKQAVQEVHRLNTELERRVAQRTTQLEAANKELEEFSYSMSHDMRAPLRAINGFSKILIEEHSQQLDDEGKRLQAAVQNNAQHMGQLIDDILHFLTMRKRKMVVEAVDVAVLVREAFAELEAAAPAGQRLRLETGALPPTRGDRDMLRQVLSNLLSNAVKFASPMRDVVIEVGGAVGADENIYHVKDNGVGFDMRYADKLFKVFERVHPTGQYEGTAIGLAIVKRIVERHGGRVWAEGKVGEGAVFYFALPRGD